MLDSGPGKRHASHQHGTAAGKETESKGTQGVAGRTGREEREGREGWDG